MGNDTYGVPGDLVRRDQMVGCPEPLIFPSGPTPTRVLSGVCDPIKRNPLFAMKIHIIFFCGVAAGLAACGPKPNEPPVPEATPTMNVIAQPTPTPGGTVSPMPVTSPAAAPVVAATPDMGAGPMATPEIRDKALIAPPTSMPGGGGVSSDPVAR